jgi:hypothetical protein
MADPERVTDLLLALRGRDIHLAGVSVQEPTLDEVFLAVTGDTKQVRERRNNQMIDTQIIPGAERELKNHTSFV